ncbi:MAG TPA: hypothetical protein VFV30_07625 [Novosphingobium sp.]|nr:hypothetical protein [Novosphingobium sp.]
MSERPPWFGKYWVPRRGRFRYIPIVWQGWAALLGAIAAPHCVWLIPADLWPESLLRLPAAIAVLLVGLALLFRLARARSVRIDTD